MAPIIKPTPIADSSSQREGHLSSSASNGNHSFPSPAASSHPGTPTPSPPSRPGGSTTARKPTIKSTVFGAAPSLGGSGDGRVAASPPNRPPATPAVAITGSNTRRTPSLSKFSRSNTSAGTTAYREKELDSTRNRASDGKNADEAPKDSSTGTGTGVGSSSSNAARATTLPPVPAPASNNAIDPLSQHILLRTNTDHSVPQRLRNPTRPDNPIHIAEGFAQLSAELLPAKNITPAGDASRDKRRGPSFLSRLSMRSSKKHNGGDFESDSELGSERRMDGINALVFSSTAVGPMGGGGYIPHHKEPPRYIRTKSHAKKNREFNRVFLAQELVGTLPPKAENGDGSGIGGGGAVEPGKTPVVTVSVAGQSGRKVVRTGGAVWATEFSMDGKYLAAGGRDHVVRIWAVISTPEERKAHEEEEIANGGTGERLSAPVFRSQPFREFEGHSGEVLDLSWSKNNFLLSSSMDKTVRLWHISRKECLCTFKHKDFVTRLSFHPRDDRFFLAGSLDTMLRLWSIPDKAVAFSAQLPDLVTAVAFSPDGKTAIAGLRNGLCLFYETEGLTLQTQLHVRSSRGKNAKGSKITGIQTMSVSPPSPVDHVASHAPTSPTRSRSSTEFAARGEVKVLITSNDSRIRIYTLREKCIDVKLKGHDNACSQIAASFSDDGKYVICGSEDRRAFIWSLAGDDQSLSLDKDKSPCEYFEAHGGVVTTALFAPTTTRMLLGQGGDPLYDLCNPPPVTLRSLEEAASTAGPSQAECSADEMHHQQESTTKKPEQSPAYIARSTHYDGNIMVTTDDMGIIKVFRQDCAFVKRRQETWETGSTFSRKLAGHGSNFISAGLGRSVSVLTRNSASSAAHSRRGSLSRSQAPSAVNSPPLGASASATAGSPDRILSWRQGIENGSERRASGLLNGGGTPARSERSLSPTKGNKAPLSPTAVNLGSDAKKQPYHPSSPLVGNHMDSPMTSPTTGAFNTPERFPARLAKENEAKKTKEGQAGLESRKTTEDNDEDQPRLPIPTPSFTFRPADEEEDELRLDPAGASHSFWNLNRWRSIAGFGGSVLGGQPKQQQNGGHGRSHSKSRLPVDGSVDEKDRDKDGKNSTSVEGLTGRRQSMGVFTTVTSGSPADNNDAYDANKKKKAKEDADEKNKRRSLPASALLGWQVGGSKKTSSNDGPVGIPTIISTRPSEDHHGNDSHFNEMNEDEHGIPVPPSSSPTPISSSSAAPGHLQSSSHHSDQGGDLSSRSRGNSYVSRLSSELSSEIEERHEEEEEEEEEMKCTRCGSGAFKAKKISGRQRLSCRRCGLLVGD